MQAVEPDGVTRFDKALRLVRQAASTAREGASVALLVARPAPEVISPFCTDPSVLGERLADLTATDAGGSLGPTLALARKLAGTRPGKRRILLFTDAPVKPSDAGGDPGSSTNTALETVTVGAALDNLAITRFAARPQIASPQTADLLLEVANFGHAPVHGNVEISSDGTLLDVKPFDLEPGARKAEVFPAIPRAGSGRLVARLDTADALALDNTAYALLPSAEPCRVLLVTKGDWFLEKLLGADPTLHFDLLAPDAFRPEMARNFDAVIYDNCAAECGLNDLGAVVGNGLFLKSSPLGGSEALEQPPVSDTDADSPLLRFVQWQTVTFIHAVQLPPPVADGWKFEAPVRSADHPLIVAGTRLVSSSSNSGEQRVAVFAFGIADSDLPLRVAFPLLISNTVHWLAGTDSEVPGAVACGQAVTLAPGETAQREPEQGAGERNPASLAAVKPSAGVKGSMQPLRNGFYRIDASAGQGESHRWLAVNTADDDESNLQSASAAPAAPEHFEMAGALLEAAGGSLWRWFALAATVLLSAEWWLFHRRKTE